MAGKSTSLLFPSSDLSYLLGVMNSRLIDFFYRTVYGGNALSGGYLRIGPPQLKEIPIRCLNLDNSSDRAANAKMSNLIGSMETLNSQLLWENGRPKTPFTPHTKGTPRKKKKNPLPTYKKKKKKKKCLRS